MDPVDTLTDSQLWDSFHGLTLPAATWTHRAHLRMAWLYLSRHSLDEAHVLMRVGIVRLNASHGLVETPTRGYHDTLTRAFLLVVAARRTEHVEVADSARFVEVAALPTDALLRHYSRERLLSLAARARFLEPDLEPLPGIAPGEGVA